ncbi:hypothetical protein [Streptomyces sp. NPDC000618]|uniref:hypothetical protein n=1 Tax=Streptomyces sp. NPDC000618 TaxID=3154265 RepID=UPI00331A097D
MSTSTLPSARGSRLGATALTVLAAAGFTCLAAPSATAVGEAGDIRIHREQVPPGVSKDDPVACRFYLDAANFADLRSVSYTIQAKPPTEGTATVTGTINLTQGAGHTDTLGLAEGSYTLSWDLPSASGGVVASTRVKVFRINCREEGRGGSRGPNRPITDDGREAAAPGGRGGGRADGDETPTGQTAAGQTGTGQTATGETAAGQSAAGQSAADQTTTGQTTTGQTATGQTTTGQTTTGQAATGQAATGQTATGQTATSQGAGRQSGSEQSGTAWSGEKSGGPEGGVHAGGGGLADTTQAFTPLAGAAAVGLVAVGGVAYFRLTRRRTHGAA